MHYRYRHFCDFNKIGAILWTPLRSIGCRRLIIMIIKICIKYIKILILCFILFYACRERLRNRIHIDILLWYRLWHQKYFVISFNGTLTSGPEVYIDIQNICFESNNIQNICFSFDPFREIVDIQIALRLFRFSSFFSFSSPQAHPSARPPPLPSPLEPQLVPLGPALDSDPLRSLLLRSHFHVSLPFWGFQRMINDDRDGQ